MTTENMTHLEAMNQLESAVSELENMKVPNVDAIEPLMQKGVTAYGAASKRINTVRAMLKELGEKES